MNRAIVAIVALTMVAADLRGLEPSGASGQGPAQPWRERYFAGEPLRFGNRVQLLLDDYAVENTFGLRRVQGPVEKYSGNPLSMGLQMDWEREWKESWTTPIPTFGLRHVIFDPVEKMYKGWARSILIARRGEGDGKRLITTVYAESRDGISWVKPELDHLQIAGRKTNLALYDPESESDLVNIRLDPEAGDPSRRFRAMARMRPAGHAHPVLVEMVSPDGRRWTLAPDPVISAKKPDDGPYSLVRDPVRNGWLLHVRPSTAALWRSPGFYGGVSSLRRMAVRMSRDLRTWSYSRHIAIINDGDDADVTILGDQTDVDRVDVFRYGDVFLGFVGLMDNLGLKPQDCHLISSRDGLDWRRVGHRVPFLTTGAPGEWDAGEVGRVSLIPDHAEPNRLRIYYRGNAVPQKEDRLPRMDNTGLAFIGRDRFVGWQAGLESGRLLTRQFLLEGNRLEINCRSQIKSPPGPEWKSEIRAELLRPPEENARGSHAEAYPGFTMEDCDPIAATDEFEPVVTWKGSGDLSSLRGKKVYIRFFIRSATLYTFRIGDSG